MNAFQRTRKNSELINDLSNIKLNSRIKASGIITKDSITGEVIFVSEKNDNVVVIITGAGLINERIV